MQLQPALQGLSCFSCRTEHDPRALQTVCKACGLPLRADYALDGSTLPLARLAGRPPTLWRYEEVLPLPAKDAVSLAEGFTPLVNINERSFIKDESRNPTGSFKARGD